MTKMQLQPLKLGTLLLERPIIAAPLAGVSDKAYRRVLKEAGVPLAFTEMVSAKALAYGNKKSRELVDIRGEERPLGMQLFGRNPLEIREAALFLESQGADIIDFNMGCPAPKVVKNGEGSALIQEPKLALEILETLAASVKVPVTLKIRKSYGNDGHDALPIIRKLGEVGVAAVFLHGRTREQYYNGRSDWEYIRQAKEAAAVPLIGNGDVVDASSAREMLALTGCDGILIGRGFLGNPFLFQEIMDEEKEFSLGDRLEAAARQLSYAVADKGEETAVKEMRKHFAWYLKGFRNSSSYRGRVNACIREQEMLDILEEIMAEGKS